MKYGEDIHGVHVNLTNCREVAIPLSEITVDDFTGGKKFKYPINPALARWLVLNFQLNAHAEYFTYDEDPSLAAEETGSLGLILEDFETVPPTDGPKFTVTITGTCNVGSYWSSGHCDYSFASQVLFDLTQIPDGKQLYGIFWEGNVGYIYFNLSYLIVGPTGAQEMRNKFGSAIS